MTTLRKAFAPYLAEANGCACPTCNAVDDQRQEVAGRSVIRNVVAYWSAVSEQLRVLTAGEHRRVEWATHAASLPDTTGGIATPLPGYNTGRDGGWEGVGLGIGSGLPDRAHRRVTA